MTPAAAAPGLRGLRRAFGLLYSDDLDTGSRERMRLRDDLHVALAQDQLVLHYQPKVDILTERVAGVEALVRWQHPERGLLYPDAFIPLAEQSGMINRLTEVLRELRDLGVRLAVDDYGTGYSSLAYLQELPVHDLKLDRSFVMRMDEDPLAAAIVRSTVGLAHTLGLRLIAEGVETPEALLALAGYGCDVAQGYHLSRPLPAEALLLWLAAWDDAHPLTAVVAAPCDVLVEVLP